jgi:hypothetical protein
MPWLAVCTDRTDTDTAPLRAAGKAAHFAYIDSILDRLLVAGPLAEPGSASHRASFFIYDVASAAEARALLEADPFFAAGIYGDVRLEPFWPAAGRWIGGTLWGTELARRSGNPPG